MRSTATDHDNLLLENIKGVHPGGYVSLEKLVVSQLSKLIVAPSVDFRLDAVMHAVLLNTSAATHSCRKVSTTRYLLNLNAFESFYQNR